MRINWKTMERIKTFKSAAAAIDLLDNGGQFYHIFTQADDDKISAAEVEKLSGSGREKQKAVLYLDLALSNLEPQERMAVEGRFDAYLNDSFTRYRPIGLGGSSRAFSDLPIGQNVWLEGTPEKIEGQGHTTGYIMVPVIDVFTFIPIDETYSVYRLRAGNLGEPLLLAHDKNQEALPETPLRIAGQINHFQLNQDKDSEFEHFVQVSYYTPI